jgi:hypothetical protein
MCMSPSTSWRTTASSCWPCKVGGCCIDNRAVSVSQTLRR